MASILDAYKAKILAMELLDGQRIHGIGICDQDCPTHDGTGYTLHIYAENRVPLPPMINDVKIERVYTSKILTFATGGDSTSNLGCQCAGTLGSLVYDATNNTPMALSNYHVYGLYINPQLNAPVISPGVFDMGTSANQIGTLTRWSNLSSFGTFLGDWAVATTTNTSAVTPGIQQVGQVAGISLPSVGEAITGFGRTSGLMKGMLMDLDADIVVDGYPFGSVTFAHQLVTDTAIASEGDSGAVIVDAQSLNAVGLLFSGSTTNTMLNPMAVVANQASIVFNVGQSLPPMPVYPATTSSYVWIAGIGLVSYYLLRQLRF